MNGRSRVLRDLIVVSVFLLLGAGLVLIDKANMAIIQSMGIGLFLVAGTHFTRRLLFPMVSLHELVKKAEETSLGASVVVASVMLFLVSVMWLSIAVVT